LGFKLLGDLGTTLDETLGVGEGEVGWGLLRGRDPGVANEKSFDIPLYLVRTFEVGVAVEDSSRDVRNMLSCVRFASDVDLFTSQTTSG
jgi:hypothetical protein